MAAKQTAKPAGAQAPAGHDQDTAPDPAPDAPADDTQDTAPATGQDDTGQDTAPDPAPADDKQDDKPAAKPKRHRKSKHDGPSVHIPMVWVVCGQGANIEGSWNIIPDVIVRWPVVAGMLSQLNAPAGHNAVVVPRPKELADDICAVFPLTKVASGKLPDLVVYPAGQGDNQTIWSEYLAEHPPKTDRMSQDDWKRTIKV